MADTVFGRKPAPPNKNSHGDDDDDDDGRVDLAVLPILTLYSPSSVKERRGGEAFGEGHKGKRERERLVTVLPAFSVGAPRCCNAVILAGKEGEDTAWMEWYWRAARIYNPTEQELIPWLSLPLYHGAAC